MTIKDMFLYKETCIYIYFFLWSLQCSIVIVHQNHVEVIEIPTIIYYRLFYKFLIRFINPIEFMYLRPFSIKSKNKSKTFVENILITFNSVRV